MIDNMTPNIKIFFTLLFLLLTSSAHASKFSFLVPNCMNEKYWRQASTSIETAEEKLDVATTDCTTGLNAELSACNALDEFPPAALACDAAAIAGCGVSIGIFGESVGLGIDDTVKIIKNCISLIPIAEYAISMTESGDAKEATPCMLDIFGLSVSVIPELKNIHLSELINEFKAYNAQISNTIQNILSVVTTTVNSINSGFDKIIKATEAFPPLAELLKLVKLSINVVFAFVPIMADVEEMAPLIILANVCNNYAPGMGGIGCLVLIQDTCSKRFKGKKGSVSPSTQQNSEKAINAIDQAGSIINKISNETNNQASKEKQENQKANVLENQYKKCKKIEKIIKSIPEKDRDQIPESDIKYFDNNCQGIVDPQ